MARPTALPARIAQASEANVYFVSPTGNDTTGDGSQGNPYRTVKKAHDVANLTASLILVRGGTYTDASFALMQNRTFTAGNGLTVRAFPGETVTISIAASNGHGMHIFNASNIRIQGPNFKVLDCGADGTRVEAFTATCTNIELSGLEIGRPGSHASATSGNGVILLGTGSGFRTTNVQIIGCKIYNAGHGWTGANNQQHGIYAGSNFGGSLGAELGAFYNNVIYDCLQGFGIHAYSQLERCVIANNTIDGCVQSGIIISGTGSGESSVECEIVNNICSNNTRYGIEYFGLNVAAGNVFHDNCFYNNAFGASITSAGRLDDTGNNITTNPLFTNRTGKDFTISTASPSRNLAAAAFAPTIDYAGSPR